MMSDEDRDIDIDTDDDENIPDSSGKVEQFSSQAEKRAHHNALERKRRDHIKDSFCSLKESVPSLHGGKASRAHILKKAADYIEFMRRKNQAHQQDIDNLIKQNNLLESQIRSLERAKFTGNFAAMTNTAMMSNNIERSQNYESPESDASDSEIVNVNTV